MHSYPASLALFTCMACAPAIPKHERGPGDGDLDTLTDTGAGFEQSLEDCGGDVGPIYDVEVLPADVEPVLLVRWRTEVPARGFLRYELPASGKLETPLGERGTEHEALVLGAPYDAHLPIVVGAEDMNERWCTTVEGDTPALAAPSLPPLELGPIEPGAFEGGYVMVPIMEEAEAWIAVLNEQGQYVWIYPVEGAGEHVMNPVFRVVPSPDGTGVLYNLQGQRYDDDGTLNFVSWDGRTRREVRVPGGHTDFAMLPDGRFAMLGWEVRSFDEGRRQLLGDTVLIVDIAGNVEELWNAFDHIPVDLSVHYPTGFIPDAPELEDWSHVNGISYDPYEDDILITVPLVDSIFRIDLGTEDVVWEVSSSGRGDFVPQPGPMPVHLPHSVQAVPGGLLVFNRRDFVHGSSCSDATQLALDEEAGTVAVSWSYASEHCYLVPFLGNAQRMEGGNTLVSFSSAGVLSVGRPDGRTAWEASLGLGAAFGFAHQVPALIGSIE